MNTDQLEFLVLGALLHDIGKFSQRAGGPANRNLVGEYCPTDRHGKASHAHVLYTDAFIEDLGFALPLDVNRSALARLAASHHKPSENSPQEMALCVADRLSAGLDRLSGGDDTGDYKTSRLHCVFESIRLDPAKTRQEMTRFHPLVSIEEGIAPLPLNQARATTYADLFEQFKTDATELPVDRGVRVYSASLLSLLEKYTWCIPSSTWHTVPDISLYDHSLTTAAIAQALAVYHADTGIWPGREISSPKFILFGGDVSGIQKYIFGIDHSHGAGVSKIFRARSFYLQMLTRSVILELLDRLRLLPVAQIMDAGGRFMLLLPATDRVLSVLEDFVPEVEEWFFTAFKGELALNLSAVTTLSEQDMEQSRIQTKLDAFHESLEQAKLHKFAQILENGRSPVFDLEYDDYEDGDCQVCRKAPHHAQASKEFKSQFNREVRICSTCWRLIADIGRHLPTARYAILAEDQGLPLFGRRGLRLTKSVDIRRADKEIVFNLRCRGEYAYLPVAGHLPTVRDEDLRLWSEKGMIRYTEDGFMSHDGEPINVGEPQTLNMLAWQSRIFDAHGPRAKTFLAALKADVDNLGFIFSNGLDKDMSISRFAGLSRMLNVFFAEDMIRFIVAEFPNIYVIFAGGDDLFLLGPWRDLVHFAGRLRERFREFTAHNPEVTLSAGISLSAPKLPVRTIAERAEELLHEAKTQPTASQKVKDAVSCFGVVVPWKLYNDLLTQGEQLEKLILNGDMTMGLAYRLLGYARDKRRFEAGEIRFGLYKSHMEYDFVRNLKGKTIQNEIRVMVSGARTPVFDLVDFPVSYASYQIRKN